MISVMRPIAASSSDSCNLRPDSDRRYFRQVSGSVTYRRRCALGTLFSPETCQCSLFDRNFIYIQITKSPIHVKTYQPIRGCLPYFSIPFSQGVQAENNRIALNNEGVQVKSYSGATGNKAAYFDGNGYIRLWALSDMEFGDDFVLSIRFALDQRSRSRLHGPYALADNSGCGKNATFGLALAVKNDQFDIHGGFILTNGRTLSKSVPLSGPIFNRWHYIVLMKTPKTFILRVDNRGIKVHSTGRVKRRSCEMRIGRGWGLKNFIGLIDKVNFYKCIPNHLRME